MGGLLQVYMCWDHDVVSKKMFNLFAQTLHYPIWKHTVYGHGSESDSESQVQASCSQTVAVAVAIMPSTGTTLRELKNFNMNSLYDNKVHSHSTILKTNLLSSQVTFTRQSIYPFSSNFTT